MVTILFLHLVEAAVKVLLVEPTEVLVLLKTLLQLQVVLIMALAVAVVELETEQQAVVEVRV
jgi:hypothetical protein